MKKLLTRKTIELTGRHPDIRGDVSDIRGDVNGIEGDVSGIRGDVSGIEGNVASCEITEEERKRGIDIKELILRLEKVTFPLWLGTLVVA